MSRKKILLIGGGGHAKSCIDVIETSGDFEIVGIIDRPDRVGESVLGHPIIGHDGQLEELIKLTNNFHIAIAQIKSCELKKSIYKKVMNVGGQFPPVVSANSYVSKYAILGEGVFIGHRAVVNADARIGKLTVVNSMALIEHESVIGDFCNISTGAIVNGNCQIGEESFIGSQSVLSQGIKIEENCIVSAGVFVKKNLEKNTTFKIEINE